MTNDSRAFRYTPATGPPRRIVFENKPSVGWVRREEVHTGCSWRKVGSEPVEDVSFADSV